MEVNETAVETSATFEIIEEIIGSTNSNHETNTTDYSNASLETVLLSDQKSNINREMKSLIDSTKDSKILMEYSQNTREKRVCRKRPAQPYTKYDADIYSTSDNKRKKKNASDEPNPSLNSTEQSDSNKDENEPDDNDSTEFITYDKKGRRVDAFCWRCHIVETTFICSTCVRTYHQRCVMNKPPEGSTWSCSECAAIYCAEKNKEPKSLVQRLSVNDICKLLNYALKKIKDVKGAEPFLNPVDANEFPDYVNYIVVPMCLNQMQKKINNLEYRSTVAFMRDVMWISHNSRAYNGSQDRLTTISKTLSQVCKKEMTQIENCPQCYANSNTVGNPNFFAEVCSMPHLILWAKVKGFPYWPAKAMGVYYASNQYFVHLNFFGQHDTSSLPAKECYVYSEQDPNGTKKKSYDFLVAMSELQLHIIKIKKIYGGFVPAGFKTLYDPNQQQIKFMIPNLEKHLRKKIVNSSTSSPNETPNNDRNNAAIPIKPSSTVTSKVVVSKPPNISSTSQKNYHDDNRPSVIKEKEIVGNPSQKVNGTHNNTSSLHKIIKAPCVDIPHDDGYTQKSVQKKPIHRSNIMKVYTEALEVSEGKRDNQKNPSKQKGNNPEVINVVESNGPILTNKGSNSSAKLTKNDPIPQRNNKEDINIVKSNRPITTNKGSGSSTKLTSNKKYQNNNADKSNRLSEIGRKRKIMRRKRKSSESPVRKKRITKHEKLIADLDSNIIPLTGDKQDLLDSLHLQPINEEPQVSTYNIKNATVLIKKYKSPAEIKYEMKLKNNPEEPIKENGVMASSEDTPAIIQIDNTVTEDMELDTPIPVTNGTAPQFESTRLDTNGDAMSESITFHIIPNSQNSTILHTACFPNATIAKPIDGFVEQPLQKNYFERSLGIVGEKVFDDCTAKDFAEQRLQNNNFEETMSIVDEKVFNDYTPKNFGEQPVQKNPFEGSLGIVGEKVFSDCTAKINEFFRTLLSTSMYTITQDVTSESLSLPVIKYRLNQMKCENEQRIDEIKYNSALTLMEMRQSFEADKVKLEKELRVKIEEEYAELLSSVKNKQWCTNCHKESHIPCCWNTSYCSATCQRIQKERHMATCQRRDTLMNKTPKATILSNVLLNPKMTLTNPLRNDPPIPGLILSNQANYILSAPTHCDKRPTFDVTNNK